MDSRVSSGRHASSSHVKLSSGFKHLLFRCRSFKDDSAESFPCCRFPTTDVTGQDWRAFRAHLVAWEHTSRRAAQRSSQLQRPPYPPLVCGDSWAHPLVEPEQGCLLLARQDNMAPFTGSVILITSHDDVTGSVGYMLNKPLPLLVEKLQMLDDVPGFKDAFGSQSLHLGGPMHTDYIAVFHRFVGIRRSRKITDGIFTGGMPDAIRLVQSGILQPSDFQLVLGLCGWDAGQLRKEIAEGYWHVISASPDLVLPGQQPSFGPNSGGGSGSGDGNGLTEGAVQGAETGGAGSRPATAVSPMYRRIARLAVRGA